MPGPYNLFWATQTPATANVLTNMLTPTTTQDRLIHPPWRSRSSKTETVLIIAAVLVWAAPTALE